MADIIDSSPALALPTTLQPLARQWREAFGRLSAQTQPCPGINLKKWPEMHTVALRFLSEHADRAAELEWTTEMLFGVHPQVGAVRVDACGALMVSSGKPVIAVERDWISFGVSRYYRPVVPAPSIPVWDWKEPKKQ